MLKQLFLGLLLSISLVNVFSYPMEDGLDVSLTGANRDAEIDPDDDELDIPEEFRIPTGTPFEKAAYWDELCRSVGINIYRNTQLFGQRRQAKQSTPATTQESIWTEPIEDKIVIEHATKNIPNEVRNLIYHKVKKRI